MKYLLLAVAFAGLAGCATGVKTKTELAKGTTVQSRSGPVCLLAGDLPDGVRATTLGRIKATKGTYGSVDNLTVPMANEARRVGADAIIKMQADQRFKGPLPWRYNAPTGDGLAVKLDEGSPPLDCAAAGGRVA
jgi:uncharacterized protein YbjQ (UPF0145 family)